MAKRQSVFGRPIAFHRAFVNLEGENGRLGITGALMLSQAIYWSERTNDEDGWFWKTAEEWEAETGMTYREQATARKRLRGFPFWQEKRKSSPARMYFRVDMEALYAEFGLQFCAKRETRFAQSAKQDSRKARNINKNTETTTETTAEREPAANAAGRKRRAGGEGDASPFKAEKTFEQKDTRENKKSRARKGKKEKVPAEILRAAVTAWAVVTGIIPNAETPVPEPVYPRLAREAKRALTAKRKALGGAAWPEVLAALQTDLRIVYRGWWAWDGRESAPGHQQVHELLARVWAGTWPEFRNRPKGKRKKARPAASVEELAEALGI